MFVNPYKIANLAILIPIIFVIYSMQKEKSKIKRQIQNMNIDKDKIISEIEILKQNKDEQKDLTEQKQEKLLLEIEKEKKLLIEKYIKFLDLGFLEEALNKSYDEILKEIIPIT